MALKDTLGWIRRDWGIFSEKGDMSLRERARWVRQWVPFSARTVGWATLSVTLGPLTAEHSASTWAARRWSRSTLKGLGIEVDVDGLDNVPAGSCVYISNHQSLLDILVLGAVLPGDFKWAAKRSLMNIPFLGWHLRLAGHVPVERHGGKHTAALVTARFEKVLREGKRLLVFPEGTRSIDGRIQPFKSGGFYAAVRAGCPVVPVALAGTHAIMGKHAVDTGDMRAREMRVVCVGVGEPLVPTDAGEEADRVADLRDRTRERILSIHAQLRSARP